MERPKYRTEHAGERRHLAGSVRPLSGGKPGSEPRRQWIAGSASALPHARSGGRRGRGGKQREVASRRNGQTSPKVDEKQPIPTWRSNPSGACAKKRSPRLAAVCEKTKVKRKPRERREDRDVRKETGRRRASPEPAARDRVLQRRREKKPVHRIHHHGNQSSETKGRNTLGDGASRGAWPPARVRGEKR